MTGLTDEMRRNKKLTEDLSKQTRMEPTPRYNKLMAFANRVNQNDECKRAMLVRA